MTRRPPFLSQPWSSASVITLLVLGSITVYLAQWLQLPLYPDEVAMRLYAERAFTDGLVQYKLYPQCAADAQAIPLTLVPAAYTLGLLDFIPAWQGVRLLPMLALGALVIASGAWIRDLCRRQRMAPWPLAWLCAAFIGVSGGGLVLSRPEVFVLLQLALIVVTLSRRRPLTRMQTIGLAVAQLLATTLCLATHMVGLLLVPLSVIALLRLLKAQPRTLALCLVALACIVLQALPYWQFSCRADPPLAHAYEAYEGAPLSFSAPKTGLARFIQRVKLYPQHFRYKQQFNPGYLPPVETPATRALNIPIYATALASLFAIFCAAALSTAGVMRSHAGRLRTGQWRALYASLRDDDRVVFAGAALTVTALFAFDLSSNFYRVFFLQLVIAILLAFAAARLRPSLARIIGIGMLLLCLASALANSFTLVPPFRQGFEGTGTRLQTDWPAVARDVATLAPRCGITPASRNLIVDDLTYAALRTTRTPCISIITGPASSPWPASGRN